LDTLNSAAQLRESPSVGGSGRTLKAVGTTRSPYPAISVVFVEAIGRYLQRLGHDPQPLYSQCGWTRRLMQDKQARVPLRSFYSLLDLAAEHARDPHLGLHVFEHLDYADLGLLGFALLYADDVGAAFEISRRYMPLFHDAGAAQLLVERDYAYLWYRVRWRELPVSRHACDMVAAFWVFFIRKVVDPSWAPVAVQSRQPTPPAALRDEYDRIFRCPVVFGSATNQLTLTRSLLKAPIRSHDRRLFAMGESVLNSLRERSPGAGFLVQTVESAIAQTLTSKTNLARVARLLRLHPRTLTRQLTSWSLKFNDMIDSVRCDLAVQLLVTTDQPLAEIAHLLGYSEKSAFSRAFRRWMDCTPNDYRRSVRRSSTL
jgi:AraC-like DNA-binding protein